MIFVGIYTPCFEDYYANKEKSGVDGIMIARGALIKPWIFTEIKVKCVIPTE